MLSTLRLRSIGWAKNPHYECEDQEMRRVKKKKTEIIIQQHIPASPCTESGHTSKEGSKYSVLNSRRLLISILSSFSAGQQELKGQTRITN